MNKRAFFILQLLFCVLLLQCTTRLLVEGGNADHDCHSHTPSMTGVVRVDVPLQVNVEIGKDFFVTCRLRENIVTDKNKNLTLTVNSTNLRLRKLGPYNGERSSLPTVVLDDKTITYEKSNASQVDSGSYACIGNVTGANGEILIYPGCMAGVSVGSRPKPVQDFRCISRAFQNLTCTWKLPDNGDVTTRYFAEIDNGVSAATPVWQPCGINASTQNSCMWTRYSAPFYERSKNVLSFRVTGENSLGHETWLFTAVHNAIVQLSPPIKASYRNLTSRGAIVSWLKPDEVSNGGWIEKMSLIYHVEVKQRNPDVTEKFESVTTQLTLSDLIPNNLYDVFIRVRPVTVRNLDLLSLPAHFTFTTPKDIPTASPKLSPGAFSYKIFNSLRTITLLFDETPQHLWNDDVFNYIVEVCADDLMQACATHSTDKSNFDVKNLLISMHYHIHIWANNSLGVSKNYSSLDIPAQNDMLPGPIDVSVSLLDGAAIVSWELPESLHGDRTAAANLVTTVFWCESVANEDACRGPAQSLTVDQMYTQTTPGQRTQNFTNNRRSLKIELKNPQYYIFGVAIADSQTGRSSGCVWSSCIKQVGSSVGQVRELEAHPDTGSSLLLRWSRHCGSRISGYQIEYCYIDGPVGRDMLDSIDECRRPALPLTTPLPFRAEKFSVPLSDKSRQKFFANLASGRKSTSDTEVVASRLMRHTMSLSQSSDMSLSSIVCRTRNVTATGSRNEGNGNPGDSFILDGLIKGGVYRIVVRAFDADASRFGPDSAAVCALAVSKGGLSAYMMVGIAVGAAVALTALVSAICTLTRWLQQRLEYNKKCKPKIPPNLDHVLAGDYDNFLKRCQDELRTHVTSGGLSVHPADVEFIARNVVANCDRTPFVAESDSYPSRQDLQKLISNMARPVTVKPLPNVVALNRADSRQPDEPHAEMSPIQLVSSNTVFYNGHRDGRDILKKEDDVDEEYMDDREQSRPLFVPAKLSANLSKETTYVSADTVGNTSQSSTNIGYTKIDAVLLNSSDSCYSKLGLADSYSPAHCSILGPQPVLHNGIGGTASGLQSMSMSGGAHISSEPLTAADPSTGYSRLSVSNDILNTPSNPSSLSKVEQIEAATNVLSPPVACYLKSDLPIKPIGGNDYVSFADNTSRGASLFPAEPQIRPIDQDQRPPTNGATLPADHQPADSKDYVSFQDTLNSSTPFRRLALPSPVLINGYVPHHQASQC